MAYEVFQTAAVAKEQGEYIFSDSDTRRLTEEATAEHMYFCCENNIG